MGGIVASVLDTFFQSKSYNAQPGDAWAWFIGAAHEGLIGNCLLGLAAFAVSVLVAIKLGWTRKRP